VVRQTLAFVPGAAAAPGIVYATDAEIAPRVQIVHRFDPAGFEPIEYPLLLLRPGPGRDEPRPEAVELFEFLASAEAGETWAEFGFTPLAPNVEVASGE
jgi:molybdate transport system substrate-binding protein